MGTFWSGSQTQILVGNENGLNTMWGTPVGFLMRKARFTFGNHDDLIEDNELRADPNPPQQETGLNQVVAQMVVPVTTEEMGLWFYWFLGGYSVTGAADPYSHVFVIDTTEPETLWVECGDLAVGKYDLYNGLVMNSISFGTVGKTSDLIMATIGFAASGKVTRNGAASVDAAPLSYSVRKHTQPLAAIKVDDTTTTLLTQMSYTINRRIDMQGVADGSLYMTDFDYGDYSYDFTVQGWRESADTIVGYDDGAEHGVELLSPRPGSATHFVDLDHNECLIKNSETQGEQGDDGPRPQTVRVLPTYIDHTDGSSCKFTVDTEIADYSALMASS